MQKRYLQQQLWYGPAPIYIRSVVKGEVKSTSGVCWALIIFSRDKLQLKWPALIPIDMVYNIRHNLLSDVLKYGALQS